MRPARTFVGGERAAGKALARFVTHLEEEGHIASKPSVAFVFDERLSVRAAQGAAPKTIEGYESYIRNWLRPNLGSKKIRELTAGDLRSLYNEMATAGAKRATMDQVRAILSAALTFVQQNEWVGQNVARLVRPTSEDRKVEREATLEEFEKVSCPADAGGGR